MQESIALHFVVITHSKKENSDCFHPAAPHGVKLYTQYTPLTQPHTQAGDAGMKIIYIKYSLVHLLFVCNPWQKFRLLTQSNAFTGLCSSVLSINAGET